MPTAKIAVMGAEAAVNAVYANKLDQLDGDARAAETDQLATSATWTPCGSETVVDNVVEPEDLRAELIPSLSPPPAARTAPPAAPPRHQPA